MKPYRILLRSLVAAASLTVLVAVPASAHPFISEGALPVDSLATMRLHMAHGCGGDDGGAEAVTTEVALEVPDWLRVVEVPDADGYATELETADDGTVTTVVWTAAGEAVPAPAFDLDVVASGEPGETRHLAVFQGCENVSYRWIGTPDDPADDPAVNVALVESDPDAPAPPVPAPEPTPDVDPTADGEPVDEPTEPATGDATEGGASDETDTDAAGAEDAAAGDDGVPMVLLGGLVVVVLAAIAVVAGRRRRRGDA